jgi:hypothetical protein
VATDSFEDFIWRDQIPPPADLARPADLCRHRPPREPFPAGSPVPRDPPRIGPSHGPQARSRIAAGDERSELALDGAEDRATSNVVGGSRVAGGGRDPAPVAPVATDLAPIARGSYAGAADDP